LMQLSLEDDTDPRVPYRVANLLAGRGRIAGAIAAYRRTVELDPSRPLVFFRLGMAYKENGDRQRAVYAFEQALMRSTPKSRVHSLAEWEVVKLSFGVIAEAGFANGIEGRSSTTPAGSPVEVYRSTDTRMAWWARVSPPMIGRIDKIEVRWIEPSGTLAKSHSLEAERRVFTSSHMEFDSGPGPAPGVWQVNAVLDGEIVHRDQIRVLP
jgi:hypothetical protein